MSFITKLQAKIPQYLPHTVEELAEFTKTTLETFGLPYTANYRRAVASMLQHYAQEKHTISKAQVYYAVLRAEAMRSAFLQIQAINKEEQAATPKDGVSGEPIQKPGISEASA